jgi:hypothetical protein
MTVKNTPESFLAKLQTTPELLDFNELMSVVDENYTFSETAFSNGDINNVAGDNSGSCKLFSFAQLHGLSEEQTLACFGIYYRDDVLKNPEANNHQNIRNFMKTGWAGLKFEGKASN